MSDSQTVEKISCTKPCGSSDGMQVYLNADGTHSAYCWVCGHYDRDPYHTNTTTKQNTRVEPVSNYLTPEQVHAYGYADLSDRGIAPAIVQHFMVKQDPGATSHFYPYFNGSVFSGYKQRVKASKEFYSVGNTKQVDLFGQAQALAAQSHRLIIVEGELDCLAAFQMLWEYQQRSAEYKDRLPSVVSLGHGASGVQKDFAEQDELFSRFKEIVLCFDNDKAGREAVELAVNVLPLEKIKVAKLSSKDANQMLLDGKAKEFCQEVLFKAAQWRPSTIKSVSEAFEAATEMPTYGASTPFPSLTELTQGVHDGDMIGVAGGVGCGKSTLWHKWMSHNVHTNHEKVGLCFLEEDIGDTLKNLATHEAQKRFISAKGKFTQEELRNAVRKLDGLVYLFEHDYHALRSDNPWDSVKAAIRHMVLVEGCKHIVVDPLTALVAQLTSSEANDALNAIMSEMEALTKMLKFTFYYGAHLNPPKTGPSHEEGGRVYLSQLTGSRAMIKWSQIILGLERNTQAEIKQERNTTTVRLLKGRKLGQLGKFQAYFDDETGVFAEVAHQEPAAYSMSTSVPSTPGLSNVIPNTPQ